MNLNIPLGYSDVRNAMNQEVLTWTMIVAGWVAVVGVILVALGLALWEGLYAAIWPAAGWMIVLGLLIGAIAGAASMLERRYPSK